MAQIKEDQSWIETDPGYQMVKEFHDVVGLSGSLELRENLVREELNEFKQALGNLLKEFADLVYVIYGTVHEGFAVEDLSEDLVEQMKQAGQFMELAVSQDLVQEAFKLVHQSNMSKFPNGQVLRREDGKVLKGPDYQPPNLSEVVEKLLAQTRNIW